MLRTSSSWSSTSQSSTSRAGGEDHKMLLDQVTATDHSRAPECKLGCSCEVTEGANSALQTCYPYKSTCRRCSQTAHRALRCESASQGGRCATTTLYTCRQPSLSTAGILTARLQARS